MADVALQAVQGEVHARNAPTYVRFLDAEDGDQSHTRPREAPGRSRYGIVRDTGVRISALMLHCRVLAVSRVR